MHILWSEVYPKATRVRLLSDKRTCPWTHLITLIWVLARYAIWFIGPNSAFCWRRQLASYLYDNSSELSKMTRRYISQTFLKRFGYANIISSWARKHFDRYLQMKRDLFCPLWIWAICCLTYTDNVNGWHKQILLLLLISLVELCNTKYPTWLITLVGGLQYKNGGYPFRFGSAITSQIVSQLFNFVSSESWVWGVYTLTYFL